MYSIAYLVNGPKHGHAMAVKDYPQRLTLAVSPPTLQAVIGDLPEPSTRIVGYVYQGKGLYVFEGEDVGDPVRENKRCERVESKGL